MSFHQSSSCSATSWLSRPAEKLVITSYRDWMTGIVRSEKEYWKEVHLQHVAVLGETHGRNASIALVRLIETLGKCASCPLQFFPTDTKHLCKDECVYLGLIAAIQHGDDEVQQIAAGSFTCKLQAMMLLAAAGDYACSLKSGGAIITPIPTDTLLHILIDSALPYGDNINPTIH